MKNHFLIAMPTLQDDHFSKAVIYLHEHSEQGAMGFLINKPLHINLGNLLSHLNIQTTSPDIENQTVLTGGPVGQEHGFILHWKDNQVVVSGSKSMLKQIAKNKGPDRFLITLGYSGWGAGQLEAEILRNDWLVVPFDHTLLFETPLAERWSKAANLIGIDIHQLSSQTGNA